MRIRTVPLSSCVHYCGFRYGRNEYNPYETYLAQIEGRVRPELAQARFVEFLQHYRPRHFGEALGCDDGLTKRYPMWNFPWEEVRQARFNSASGWLDDPNDCPDILTHFSERGILQHRIEEEFYWLERALRSIKSKGYRPFRHWNFIRALTLRRANGTEAHLLLDGNHRAAAMSALGYTSFRIYQAKKSISENTCSRWPGVASGHFRHEDALRIFHAYFEGNFNYRTVLAPAPVIATADSRVEAEFAQ